LFRQRANDDILLANKGKKKLPVSDREKTAFQNRATKRSKPKKKDHRRKKSRSQRKKTKGKKADAGQQGKRRDRKLQPRPNYLK